MSHLVVRHSTEIRVAHVPGSAPSTFTVIRLSDGKTSPPVSISSPSGFPVEDRPNSDLLGELQWYLETFLDYPFPPETNHADRVLQSLRSWGQHAFSALFENRAAGRFFDDATTDNYSSLYLQIASDDPQILAWPWEALYDPEVGWLAHTCQIERRLNTVRDPQPLSPNLPTDRVNILLVVARPYGRQDVRFRSIARPLVDLIERDRLPAHVELLRPPTFDCLRKHLHDLSDHYHILHFDGHGSYGLRTQPSGNFRMQSPEGTLVFETDTGEPDPIPAEKLGTLLKEHALPSVVLNACQSAMVDAASTDPFASVATTLLRSGVRDVVAMAYSLYVRGAQQFLPSFYRRLFEAGDMAAATRAGRQQMWRNDRRISPRGNFPLQDWLLPVLYRQAPITFSFATEVGPQAPRTSQLPEELQRTRDPHGFVGRDSAILELERALRRAPAGILIQGLGGVGKTTLARGFLRWLDSTAGLANPPFWLSFQEIRSAEYVFNRLGESIFGGNFPSLSVQKKVADLTKIFRESRYILVWDNFESATGIPNTAVTPNLSDEDRRLLATFLDELRDGATKILITSRSTEDWLGPQRRYILTLGGLDHEERWEHCEAILRDLGLTINRDDRDLIALMDLLGGHPLSMRMILPRLEKMTAAQIAEALRSNLSGFNHQGGEDDVTLFSTLQFVQQALPEKLRPLLIPLGMHDGYVHADDLEIMARHIDELWTQPAIDQLMQALVSAGLLRNLAPTVYECHPLLTSYLRSNNSPNTEDRSSWARVFVARMSATAYQMSQLELNQQRDWFQFYGQNFYSALSEAEKLASHTDVATLLSSLGNFAFRSRNLFHARHLYERLANQAVFSGNSTDEANAYHGLGMVAGAFRDLSSAEQWYRKSIEITEKLGDEKGLARTYHQLGFVAQEKREFGSAEQWFIKSLKIKEELNDDYGVATTYHMLGRVAQEQGNLIAAHDWYDNARQVEERIGNEILASTTYHELGNVAYLQGELISAEEWYRKSLQISQRLGNDDVARGTFHQLGIIAQTQDDVLTAEKWYRKSLAIAEKSGNYREAAGTYGQLGTLANTAGNFFDAGQWIIKATVTFLQNSDPYSAEQMTQNFQVVFARAGVADQAKLKAIWAEAGLGKFPAPQED